MNFSKFSELLKKQLLDNSEFEITNLGKTYIWIGKRDCLRGIWSCHYEIIVRDNQIHADIHFENTDKNVFMKIVQNDYEEIKNHNKGVTINSKGLPIEESSIAVCLDLIKKADDKFGEQFERKLHEIYSLQISRLVEKYKLLLKSDSQKAIIKELYKWDLIESTKNKDVKTLIESVKKSNLVHGGSAGALYSYLLRDDPEEVCNCIENLLDESKDIEKRYEDYQIKILALCDKHNYGKMFRVADERTAISFLTFKYPDKYAFFKPGIYNPLIEYFDFEKKENFKRVLHYQKIVDDIVERIKTDSELINELKKHLKERPLHERLIAQTIFWNCLGAEEKEDKETNMEEEKMYQKYADLLQVSKNLILTGAPGTGKSYIAKKIAEKMDAEWEFVQFHPSYDYTDFVEGLRPTTPDANGNIGFRKEDGLFKEFCRRALNNFVDSKKTEEDLGKEVDTENVIEEFLDKAIAEKTIFETVNGSKFSVTGSYETTVAIVIPANAKPDLVLSKIQLKELVKNNVTLEKGDSIKNYFKRKWRTQMDSYNFVLCKKIQEELCKSRDTVKVEKVPEKKFVFIIDEINRGEVSKIFGELFFSIDPGYRGVEGKVFTQYANMELDPNEFDNEIIKSGEKLEKFGHFFIPENVYIIGTMNDIDRSVESMDFAFRRRFRWEEIKAEENLFMLKSINDAVLEEEAIKRMNSLNKTITEDLGEAYNIGASYFLKLKECSGSNEEKFKDLWEGHLKSLLSEYLRGRPDYKEVLGNLENAYNLKVANPEMGNN